MQQCRQSIVSEDFQGHQAAWLPTQARQQLNGTLTVGVKGSVTEALPLQSCEGGVIAPFSSP